jgi:tRNA(Ile2) C34 agmatinyltransferase TiaS
MSAEKREPRQQNVPGEPLSLHGMTPEEAIQRMFSTRLPSKPMYCPKCRDRITGLGLVGDEGELRCPKCGTIATNEQPQP